MSRRGARGGAWGGDWRDQRLLDHGGELGNEVEAEWHSQAYRSGYAVSCWLVS